MVTKYGKYTAAIATGGLRLVNAVIIVIVGRWIARSLTHLVRRVMTRADDYWDVLFATTEAVKQRFDAENISIPFPQRDVHLYQH